MKGPAFTGYYFCETKLLFKEKNCLKFCIRDRTILSIHKVSQGKQKKVLLGEFVKQSKYFFFFQVSSTGNRGRVRNHLITCTFSFVILINSGELALTTPTQCPGRIVLPQFPERNHFQQKIKFMSPTLTTQQNNSESIHCLSLMYNYSNKENKHIQISDIAQLVDILFIQNNAVLAMYSTVKPVFLQNHLEFSLQTQPYALL